jgi:hypothetical protein
MVQQTAEVGERKRPDVDRAVGHFVLEIVGRRRMTFQ